VSPWQTPRPLAPPSQSHGHFDGLLAELSQVERGGQPAAGALPATHGALGGADERTGGADAAAGGDLEALELQANGDTRLTYGEDELAYLLRDGEEEEEAEAVAADFKRRSPNRATRAA